MTGDSIFRFGLSPDQWLMAWNRIQKRQQWTQKYHNSYYFYYDRDQTLLADDKGQSKVYRRKITNSIEATWRGRQICIKSVRREPVNMSQTTMGSQQHYQHSERIYKWIFADASVKIIFETVLPTTDTTNADGLLSELQSNERKKDRVYQIRLEVVDPTADLTPYLQLVAEENYVI